MASSPTPAAAETPALELIERFFHPASIAIVGATERPGYCARLFNNLLQTGYRGRILPVNPNRERVFDLPCYPTPLDLPEVPDLVILVVPSERVLESLRQCAARGARAAIILSAGFAELPGEAGAQRQAELHALAAETGLRLVGPNCLGVANLAQNIWATAASQAHPRTLGDEVGAALISQSGATAFGPLTAVARDRGLDFRYIVTTGNEADLSAADFIQYFLGRPDVQVLSLLVESFRDGRRLRRLAERARRERKVLVVLKVGRSEAGRRAARSHTAALAGDDRVQDALFCQLGLVRVRDYDELVEQTLLFLKAPLPTGSRIGVVSHSGGIGAHVSDLLGVEGLEVPPLAADTSQRLGEVLGERGSASNPADITTFANGPAFGPILDTLFADPGLDAWVVATQGADERVGKIVTAAAGTSKPVVIVWTGDPAATDGLPMLRASPVPVFPLPGGAARGLASLVRLARDRARPEPPAGAGDSNGTGLSLPNDGGALSEYRSKRLLAAAGVDAPPETLCQTADEAAEAACRLGYPVVLKACAPELPHKSDLGLVRLDLRSEQELRQAFDELLAAARRAELARLEGVLVQPYLRGGIETIVGLADDERFGPLIMLGLGGSLVETLDLVTWRACPIDLSEAEAMIDDLPPLGRLLAGVRGARPADRAALSRALVSLSELGSRLGSRLDTLDVNPLLVRPAGQGALALDALVVLKPAGPDRNPDGQKE